MKFCRTNRKKRKVCGRQEEKLNGCSEGNQSERIMGLEQVQSDQSDQVWHQNLQQHHPLSFLSADLRSGFSESLQNKCESVISLHISSSSDPPPPRPPPHVSYLLHLWLSHQWVRTEPVSSVHSQRSWCDTSVTTDTFLCTNATENWAPYLVITQRAETPLLPPQPPTPPTPNLDQYFI